MQTGGLAQLGEHLPYKQRVIGSSPITSIFLFSGPLAQSAEHLTFNQRVAGSNPAWLIFQSNSDASLAQLDRASDFGSEGYGFESYTMRFLFTREAINSGIIGFLILEN